MSGLYSPSIIVQDTLDGKVCQMNNCTCNPLAFYFVDNNSLYKCQPSASVGINKVLIILIIFNAAHALQSIGRHVAVSCKWL